MQTLRCLSLVCLLLPFEHIASATPAEAYRDMERGDYTSAAEKWQQIANSESEFVTALINLAYCQMQLGDYSTAADLYLRADAISPGLDSKAGVQWAYLALGRYGESRQWGRPALSLDANNYWVNYRLALALEASEEYEAAEKKYAGIMELYGARSLTLAPRAQLIPYYQSINYSGSSRLGSGFDTGLFGLYNFDAGVSTGAGYALNQVGNPKTGNEYSTHEIRLLTGFLFDDLATLVFNSHVLSSNSAFLGRGLTLSATYRPGSSRFSITGDVMAFAQHGGGALSPVYEISVARGLTLGIGGQVQAMAFAQATQFYAAAQAHLRYCAGIICASGGGLYGSLFTPVLDNGNSFVYNPDEIRLMAFARLAIRPAEAVELSAAYTFTQWKSIPGEAPVSGVISIAVTGSLQ